MTRNCYFTLPCALLLAAGLATVFEARAVEVIINDEVTRTNNNVILDGDDKITINKGGSITVDQTSPGTVGPRNIITGSSNVAVLLRGLNAAGVLIADSNKNTVTNLGTITASGPNARGVSTTSNTATNNTVINHKDILVTGSNSVGVLLGQNSMVINHGRIITKGMSDTLAQLAVRVGNNSTITNNGLIDMTTAAAGILAIGSGSGRVTLNNNAKGRIIQRAAPASMPRARTGHAVELTRPNSTVNNAGRIEKFGRLEHGVYFSHNAANSNNVLNNSGMIITNDDASIAVLFGPETFPNNSTGNKLNNTGTIETKGDNANAVQGDSGNTITNGKGGVIKTAGRLSRGIELDDNNTITNDGTIETTGRFAYGIEVDDGNRITIGKDGKIKTSGFVAHGISAGLRTGNNTIINNGEISVSGDQARGISGSFTGGAITNNGRIITSGPRFANGINVSDDRVKITNNGVIHTKGKGQQSRGISADNNSEIINNGTITTEGLQSDGIRVDNNNTLTISGSVISVQSNALALGNNNTLNLSDSAFLAGSIRLGSNNTVNVTSSGGPSGSILWDFSTSSSPIITNPINLVTDNLNIQAGEFFYHRATQQLGRFDPSVFAAAANMLGDISGSLSAITGQRFQHSRHGLWAAGQGGWSDYAGRNTTADQDFDYYTAALGYDLALNEHTLLGVLAGYHDADLTIKGRWMKSYQSDLKGPFAGFYGQRRAGPFFLNILLSGGIFEQEISRFVNDNLSPRGIAEIEASPDNWWLSPQFEFGADYEFGEVRLSPSVQLRYALQRADDYREQGGRTAASRAEVEERDIEVLETRLQILVGREFHDGSISTHVGWQHRDDHSDEHVQVKLLGQSRELEIDTRVGSNFYVGGEAQFKVAGGLLLALTGEAVFGSQRYRNVQGVISLSRPF